MDIEKLSDQQFALVYNQIVKRIQEDPISNFVKAQGFIDLEPSPTQEVILKVIFNKPLDGVNRKTVNIETRSKKGGFITKEEQLTEIQIYEFITEAKYRFDSALNLAPKINKINLICGRRSGKTLISAIISIYVAISTNWKPFLKKTPFATVLIMSHSREFSDEVLEVIRTLVETSDVLRRLINKDKKNTASTINLKVPWILDGNKIQYSRVQIKVAAASSKTTRGVAACAILCDEIAYWNSDETMTETDAKIINAVRPSMKQFSEHAMLIKLSSPGLKRGVLYDEYRKHLDGTLPKSYAVFKAPTWMMNNILPINELREEYDLNPEGFDVEYRANFADSISYFITPEYIELAVLRKITFIAPDQDGTKYAAAIDAAYKGDAFTFSVTGYLNGRLKQYVSKGWKGSRQKPVSSFEIAEFIRVVCKQFNIDEVGADQYSFQPLREIFGTYGVTLKEYTFTPAFKKKIYFNLKKLIHSQQADLLDIEIQTRELKELVVEQSQSGQIKISHPMGGTDDYADALAVSAFLATEQIGTGIFEVVSGAAGMTYGMNTDLTGKAFKAPSPDMLRSSGHLSEHTLDNSTEFAIDPKTGKLIKREDLEDDGDDGSQIIF